ncbi:MAG: hypothetical protein QOH56_4506, partial [Pseudonocardiales bacterium]|nr:hypothetical protein [Pseudonocardiales bacterium]
HEEAIADTPWLLRAASAIMLNGVVLLRAVGLFGQIAHRMANALAARSTGDQRIRALIAGAYLACYSKPTQVAMIRAENRLADNSGSWVRRARSASALPDVPLAVLTATRGKPAKSVQRCAALAEQVVSSVRRGRHVVVGDSGHYIHHDQPAAVVDAIRHIIDATGSQMRQA